MITFNVLEGAKIINEKRFSAKKSRGARMLRSGIGSAAQGCCAPVLNLHLPRVPDKKEGCLPDNPLIYHHTAQDVCRGNGLS